MVLRRDKAPCATEKFQTIVLLLVEELFHASISRLSYAHRTLWPRYGHSLWRCCVLLLTLVWLVQDTQHLPLKAEFDPEGIYSMRGDVDVLYVAELRDLRFDWDGADLVIGA